MKRQIVASALLLVLLLPMLAACSLKQGEDTKTERVLRIAANYDEQGFRDQFTELFEFANPNIHVEIVSTMDDQYRYGYSVKPGEKRPDPLEKLKELMKGDNPPDVVMFNYEDMPDLIGNNLLAPLDTYIAKDKFDTSDIVPAVLDGLKKQGDNKLYALAPIFSSSALIYNKALFQEAGVDFPKDGMTWQETFDLAKRVARPDGDNPKYGFSFNTGYGDLYNGMSLYVAPLQLTMFNDDATKMTVDSDQWEKVWTTLAQLQKDKVVPPPPEERMRARAAAGGKVSQFDYDDFLSGRLAMAIINYSQLDQIINVNKNAANFEGFQPINWDVVTVPSHPEAPGVGGNIYMNGIMGINANAQNAPDAWKFIKFVNSEDWAKLKSHSQWQLVSRSKYIKPADGLDFHIEAFYNTIPAQQTPDLQKYRQMPNLYMVQNLGRQYFQKVLQGEEDVRAALKEWQTQGDTMLQQIKDNPDGQMMGKAVPWG